MPGLHLILFLDTVGHHEAAWRRPGADPRAALDPAHYLALARTAEAARLDAVFLADNLALPPHMTHRAQSPFEPLTLLSAMAAVTERVGLIGTASTTYGAPFTLARQFASLDHLSRGRSGWNVVTSAYAAEAANHGVAGRADHDTRYARAEEVLGAARALWDSWDDDAVVADVARGHFVDPDRLHPVDRHGSFVDVAGPLTAPRPPQGHPVIVQAGSSPTGRAFAARHAEVVFSASPSLDEAAALRRELRTVAAAAGRDPDSVLSLPGLSVIVASTAAEARARQAELDDLAVPEFGLPQLSALLDQDLAGLPLDGPLPSPDRPVEGMQSRALLIRDLAARDGLSIRRVIGRLAGGRGHLVVVGTPDRVADEMEQWWRGGAADGFTLMPQRLPEDFDALVEHVLPELRRRGVFRSDYRGTTLRDHLGLPRPATRDARAEVRT